MTSGVAPEVSITATVDGETLGTLCIGGPETLEASVDATVHTRDDRFTVTLPAEWLQPGMALEVQAGSDVLGFTADELGLAHAPELNLMLVMMDVLNYNSGDVDCPSRRRPSSRTSLATTAATVDDTLRMSVLSWLSTALRWRMGTAGHPDATAGGAEESPGQMTATGQPSAPWTSTPPAASSMRSSMPTVTGEATTTTATPAPSSRGLGWKDLRTADYTWVTIHERTRPSLPRRRTRSFRRHRMTPGMSTPGVARVRRGGGTSGPTSSTTALSPIANSTGAITWGSSAQDAAQYRGSGGVIEGPVDSFSDFSVTPCSYRWALTNARGWVIDPLHGEVEWPASSRFPVVDVMAEVPAKRGGSQHRGSGLGDP